MELLSYIQSNWIEWIFAFISLLLTVSYQQLSKNQKEQKAKNQAIADGMEALLRDNIICTYNKYQMLKYCPIYAKESVKIMYAAYHNLGGNDVATTLYNKILEMPEEEHHEKDELEGKA